MTQPWKSHGLIRHPTLEVDYRAAQISLRRGGSYVNPKEEKTIVLFTRVLGLMFPEPYFNVLQQISPSEESGLKCDFLIRGTDNLFAPHALCFAEGKRAMNTRGFEIRQIKDQVRRYCLEFLQGEEKRDLIYACTLIGSTIRCWRVHRGQADMEPMWTDYGDNVPGSFQGHLDVGFDEHVDEIERAFAEMKGMRFAAAQGSAQYASSHQLPSVPRGLVLSSSKPSSSAYGMAGPSTYNLPGPSTYDTAGPSTYSMPGLSTYDTEGTSTYDTASFSVAVQPAYELDTPIPDRPSLPTISREGATLVNPVIRREGRAIDDTEYRFDVGGGLIMDKPGRDWVQGQVLYDGAYRDCCFIESPTRGIFYTWTLDLGIVRRHHKAARR